MYMNTFSKKDYTLITPQALVESVKRGVIDPTVEDPVILNLIEINDLNLAKTSMIDWRATTGKKYQAHRVFIFNGITFYFKLPKTASSEGEELNKLILDFFLGFFGNFFKDFFNAEFNSVRVYLEKSSNRLHIKIGLDKPVRMICASFAEVFHWFHLLFLSVTPATAIPLEIMDLGNFDFLVYEPDKFLRRAEHMKILAAKNGVDVSQIKLDFIEPVIAAPTDMKSLKAFISNFDKQLSESKPFDIDAFKQVLDVHELPAEKLAFNVWNVLSGPLVETQAFFVIIPRSKTSDSTSTVDYSLNMALGIFIPELKKMCSIKCETDLVLTQLRVYCNEKYIKMCIPFKQSLLYPQLRFAEIYTGLNEIVFSPKDDNPAFYINQSIIYLVPADALSKIDKALTARGDTKLL